MPKEEHKNKTKKNKPKKVYSKGDQNYIIDSIVHPLVQKSAFFVIVDEALHVIVEKDPAVSAEKFVRYSLPQLIKKAKKRG